MKDIVLTGFMGTGKSTVGRALSRQYGLPFLDLDEEIERQTGRSIPEIFAQEGESGFRSIESTTLASVTGKGGRVVATGGGTLISEDNYRILGKEARIFCLTCDFDEVQRRIGASDRPLAAGGPDRVRTLFHSRQRAYARFAQIETGGRTPEEVAMQIGTELGLSEIGKIAMERTERSTVMFRAGVTAEIATLLDAHALHGTALLAVDGDIARLGLHQPLVQSFERGDRPIHCVEIPPGESSKSLAGLARLFDAASSACLDRQSVVIGMGGGVVGDLAGMLAATYLRGIELVLVPTTLLAQVDASIGGKVGIDLPGGKNLAGAFHPARIVAIDPETLTTLPLALLSDGLAEVIKVACMYDGQLLQSVEALPGPESIHDHPEIVRAAALLKVAVVQRDPFERGERAYLNYGHTVGHAVEAASDFQLSHGSAVAVGMVAETRLAVRKGVCDGEVLERLVAVLSRMRLPVTAPAVDPDSALSYTLQDKKRRHGAIRLAVPSRIGRGQIIEATQDELRGVLRSATERAS